MRVPGWALIDIMKNANGKTTEQGQATVTGIYLTVLLLDKQAQLECFFVVLACHQLVLDGFDQLLSFELSTL